MVLGDLYCGVLVLRIPELQSCSKVGFLIDIPQLLRRDPGKVKLGYIHLLQVDVQLKRVVLHRHKFQDTCKFVIVYRVL